MKAIRWFFENLFGSRYRPTAQSVRSGDFCKCGHCGFIGTCYGALTGNGGTAPWCRRCGKNDKLSKVKLTPETIVRANSGLFEESPQ